MKQYLFLILCVILLMPDSIAQKWVPKNLVPNPSFEHLIHLPLRPNMHNYFEKEPLSGFIPFQKNMAFWKSANKNTPDLRIVDSENYADGRRAFEYFVKPKRGRAMVGVITYLSNYSSNTYREYLTVKLLGTVKPGIKTYVELWICKDRKAKLVSNNIGFYFSQRPVEEDIRENLSVKPQFNWTKVINKDDQKWEKIEGYFIPDKPYIYLTIGNFGDNENTIQQKSEHHSAHARLAPYASYLIDEVRVWQEGDTLMEERPHYHIVKKKPMRLENIHFETNSAQLKDASFEELNRLLGFLKENPKLKIAIHGHTDNVGADDFNLVLSQSRAEAVRNYLTEKGVDLERLGAKGFGETVPVASNDDKEGRLLNRRVEFVVQE